MPEPDHTQQAQSRPPSATDELPSSLPGDPTGSWHQKPPPGCPARVGRYEVRAVLGEGAFGRVYHGFDAELGREVAIKVPHPQGLTPAVRERFLREARAAATIHHPNVCPIFDVGTDGELPFIVMRFVAGGTLADLLARRKAPPPPKFALSVARQLALGVAAAHAEGVVHRDLKPGNALWDDARRQVIVTDFGLARVGGEAAITGQGDVLGTPSYMSPEQARGDTGAVGPLSDVYSLGVILYRMLTGETPYTGTVYEIMIRACEGKPRPPSGHRPELDPALDALCLKAMAVDPAARYPSARVFADALGDYLRKTEGQEDLPLAEPIADPAARRGPAPGLELVSLPPAAQTRGTVAEPTPRTAPKPAPPRRPPPPDPAEASVAVVCPRCRARMKITPGRTKPVPCPMCDCLFSVGAGRQAAARAAGQRGTSRSSEHRAAIPVYDLPDDDRGDAGPRPEWRPVAAGLTLAWSGSLVIVLFVVLAVGYALATAGQRRGHDAFEYWAGQLAIGCGLGLGMVMVGAGRWWVGAVPPRVRGGLAGRLGAAAVLVGTAALAVGYAILTRVLWYGTTDAGVDAVYTLGVMAALMGLGWLVVAEWLYHRQLAGVARRVPDYPHMLAASTRVLFLLVLVPGLLCAGLFAVEVVLQRPASNRWLVPAMVLSGVAAAGLSPFWLLLSHWLTGASASAVARHARGEDD